MSKYNKEYFLDVLVNRNGLSDVEVIQETPNHLLFIGSINDEYKLYLGIVGEEEPYKLNSMQSKSALIEEADICFSINKTIQS